jgi:hypothetical protein
VSDLRNPTYDRSDDEEDLTAIIRDAYLKTTRNIIDRMHREDVIKTLESVSIQCYDEESTESLRDALFENVKDGTIHQTDLYY